MYEEFVEQSDSTKSFHDPISKSKVKLFKNSIKKLSVTKGNKMYVTEVNCNILAKLTSSSAKTGKAVQFEDALKYPLSPVPLSLALADGSKRHTQESKLMDILKLTEAASSIAPAVSSHYIIDAILFNDVMQYLRWRQSSVKWEGKLGKL